MGRWAQARKRGTAASALASFAFSPPDDTDWAIDGGSAPDMAATSLTAGPGPPKVAFQVDYVGGEFPPDGLWVDAGSCDVLDTTAIGSFGPGRLWVRAAWADAFSIPVSDWSTPQFFDIA